MNSETKNLFGFCEDDSITLESIKKMFKTRIMASDIPVLNLTEHGLYLLQSIAKNFGNSVLDTVFCKSVESSLLSRNDHEECIDICISDFKAVTHKSFLKTLENKFLSKSQATDYINFELVIPDMRIPYVKNKIFSSLKIQATSSSTDLKLKLIGDSSFIFILFYLRKCLELFIKNLPVPLRECYLLKDRSATSTDSCDTDSSDITPMVKKGYKRIVYNSSSDEMNTQPQQISNNDVLQCEDGLAEKDRGNKTQDRSSVHTIPESGSPVFKRKKRNEKMECTGCAMYFISRNVQLMVESDYMPLRLTCTSHCVMPDIPDTLNDMALSMFTMICRTDHVNKNTIVNFCINFQRICTTILDRTPVGRDGFYVKMLTDLKRVKTVEANRIVTVLNEIVGICMEQVKSFEEKLIHNKAARRNIISYLKSTGAIFSVISVIETWHKMFLKEINLSNILPPKLCFILDMFRDLAVTSSRLVHHENMSHIARNVLQVMGGNEIQVIELKKKDFRVGHTGRTIDIPEDLYLYHNKAEKNIVCFLFYEHLTVAEKIDLKNASFDKEGNRLLTNKWIFQCKNIVPKEILQLFIYNDKKPTVTQEPIKSNENEKEGGSNSYSNEDEEANVSQGPLKRNDNEREDVKKVPNKQNENEAEVEINSCSNLNEDGGGSSDHASDNDAYLDERRHCVIPTAFMVEKNNISKYWPPNEKVNKKREFNATRVALDWPKMYGGVCPIVLNYNYVTKYGSRKLNANFAKLVGKCVICNSKHTFSIEQNPFEENVEGGLIKYEAVRDMIVDVEAEGDFFVDEGEEPSIKKPVHMKGKARGLHLKGRERELLGDLAAQQGVLATHREQMAYAIEEQIEVGNTTSMRSYPVIKMAKQQQEKKQ